MKKVKKFNVILPENQFEFCYFKTQFNDNVLYQPQTQNLYAVDNDFISYVDKYDSIDFISGVPSNMEPKLAEYFNEICIDVKEKLGESVEKNNNPENYFRQVVINISHDCNLRCQYCYASQGSYGREIGLLSKDVADQILKFFKGKSLGRVMFFGGEPLLNIDVIEHLCNGFLAQQETAPTFSLITNGTIINDSILNILKKYKILVTVSLDGPQEIHDRLRPFEDGLGSYDLIKSNISKLRDSLGDNNVSIETVYTKHHLAAGFDMSSLRKYIIKDLNLNGKNMVLCHSCMGEDKSLSFELKEELDNIEKLYNSFYQDILTEDNPVVDWEWVDSIISIGKKKVLKAICPLGEAVVCITPDGDIYPCHNLAMINELKIGNVFKNNLVETVKKAKEMVGIVYKSLSSKCQECWFIDKCKGCPAKIYFSENSIENIPDWFCNSRVDFFIQKTGWFVKLIKDGSWDLFQNKLLKISSNR